MDELQHFGVTTCVVSIAFEMFILISNSMCIAIKRISKINRNIIMEFVLSWPEKIVFGIFSSVKIQVYFMNLNVNESLRLN